MFVVLAEAIRIALLAWLGAVLLLVLHRIVADRLIHTSLVIDRTTGNVSLHRLQMIGISVVFAGAYLVDALSGDPAKGLPDISTPLLAALLGSHAAYLGGTAMRLRRER